jgi:hypothetical protein
MLFGGHRSLPRRGAPRSSMMHQNLPDFLRGVV